MSTLPCAYIQSSTLQVARSNAAGSIAPALVEHVATCATCQGALLLMFASMTNIQDAAEPIACSECERELAAFVDMEQSAGAAAALHAYPQVAWHLWTCPACAEVYQLTLALCQAERSGALSSIPLGLTMPRLLPAIHLRRPFLNATLPVRRAQRATVRGGDADEQVVYAEALAQFQVRLSMLRQQDDRCALMAATVPAAHGRLRLRLGSYTAERMFDSAGLAQVVDLPPLLDAPDGPDLVIEIELAAE